MTDLYIDPTTHDLLIESGGFRYTILSEQTRQRLEITLKTYKGEWFPNKDYGAPYLKNDDNQVELLGKTTLGFLETILKEEILKSPNIEQLITFSVDNNRVTREIKVTFEALMEDGTLIEQTVVV